MTSICQQNASVKHRKRTYYSIINFFNEFKFKFKSSLLPYLTEEEVYTNVTIHSLCKPHTEQWQYLSMDSTYSMHLHMVECHELTQSNLQDTTFGTVMTATELKLNFKITTDTLYLTLMGELWGVNCEDLGEIDCINTAPHCTCTSMGWCKEDATPMLMHWSHVTPAPAH